MVLKITSFVRSTLLMLPAIILVVVVSPANGQSVSEAPAREEMARMANSPSSNMTAADVPVFMDYRGVTIGMSAKAVRAKLDRLKQGDEQDLLIVSDQESAQIFYDDAGKVVAISVDYFGEKGVPTPDAVLGVGLQAKSDGSMYQLNRYPEAGYWVSYNRTAGDKAIVTITMQKM
jgi:hypothetical protein